MEIKDITYFIQVAKELRKLYNQATPERQRKLLTMLKTWLFYNSGSKEIFWTGKSSNAVTYGNADKVKEHMFGNLSSVQYIMNPQVGNEDFFSLNPALQVGKIFSFMQWNYTSSKENQQLRELQNVELFYNQYEGNPKLIYDELGIELVDILPENDLYPRLTQFLNNNFENKGYIFEVTLSNGKLIEFSNYLNAAAIHFGYDLSTVKIGRKGMIFKIGQKSFAKLYKLTMYSLWKCFRNQNEINHFLIETNRTIGQSGPYRSENNFDSKYGEYAFPVTIVEGNLFNNTIWLSSRYNDTEKYRLIQQLLEYFSANLFVYNYNLTLKF